MRNNFGFSVAYFNYGHRIYKGDCGSTREKGPHKKTGIITHSFPKRHKIMGLTILGDDLHCNQPFIENLESKGYHYITTCKEGSHKYLYDWINTLREGKDLKTVCNKRCRNGRHQTYKYEYVNGVDMREQEAIRGSFIKLTIQDLKTGKQKTFAYLTNYKISARNVEALVNAARRRWKIENEGHNILKTQGYNFEKNYSHGKQNLCQLITTMKLLSLSMHVLIDYVKQEGLAKVRKSYSSIKKAMEIIRTLFWMKNCKDWAELYGYAIRGIDSS